MTIGYRWTCERSAPRTYALAEVTKETAFELFAKDTGLEQVTAITGHTPRYDVGGYLAEFIQMRRAQRLDPWIDPKTYRAVAEAVKNLGTAYLKPIFDQLDGKVRYEQIRVIGAHLNVTRDARRTVHDI